MEGNVSKRADKLSIRDCRGVAIAGPPSPRARNWLVSPCDTGSSYNTKMRESGRYKIVTVCAIDHIGVVTGRREGVPTGSIDLIAEAQISGARKNG